MAFDFFYNKLALADNGYVRARLARTPAQRAAEFIHDAMTKWYRHKLIVSKSKGQPHA
jgi:hypothetical protein